MTNQTERRSDKFHLDRTINISTLIACIIFLFTIISYGNTIVNYLHEMNNKTNIMWDHFITTNPEYKLLYPESVVETSR